MDTLTIVSYGVLLIIVAGALLYLIIAATFYDNRFGE